MWMPEKDHPVWKLAQSLVSVIGLGILAFHFADHTEGLNAQEAVSGAVGGGIGLKLATQFIQNFHS